MASTQAIPSYTAVIPRNILAEPIGGSREVFYYMENFPESVYRKSPETLLFKLLSSIMGPAGVGGLSKELFELRQSSEEMGITTEELNNFFANPLGFERSPQTAYKPKTGPITTLEEQTLKSADAEFLARAVNYISGVRAGNTPLGLTKVALAGLGYSAEIVENYQFLFDQHSDKPLGLPYYGKTLSTEEFIILPQPEVSVTPILNIKIQEATEGYIYFGFGRANQPTTISEQSNWALPKRAPIISVPFNANRDEIRSALESLTNVGAGNVNVSGQYPEWKINFQNELDVGSIELLNIYNKTSGTIYLTTYTGEIEANEEIINVTSEAAYSLMNALERIKPVDSIPTIASNTGIYKRIHWNDIFASSEFSEAARFVSGNRDIHWPTEQPRFWIRPSQEIEAPHVNKDVHYAYQGWHNIISVKASSTGVKPLTNLPISSEGPLVEVYQPQEVLTNYAEPLWITSSEPQEEEIYLYINGIYPIEYDSLEGLAPLNFSNHFWVSVNRSGEEFLELEFESAQAINYITFDIVSCPVQINVFYDTYDRGENRNFVPITPIIPYNNILTNSNESITTIELAFCNSLNQMIYSKRLKIGFSRREEYEGQIEVQNLRVGRNI